MTDTLALILALCALAAALAAAVVAAAPAPGRARRRRRGRAPGRLGATSVDAARAAIDDLGPTVGFLAALLVLSEGCRREGLFDAIGVLMAVRADGSARRLLALVFAVAAVVTAVLSLDATVVLLTPIVLVTAQRMGTSPKPHLYACSHLANSASLLLPVSNLTNLLAFHASGLSFTRFGLLMTLPWIAALSVEWAVLSRFFGRTGRGSPAEARTPDVSEIPHWPRLPLAVVGLTLAGFGLSSALGIEPVWVAVAGAVAITMPALARRTATPLGVVRSAHPAFLALRARARRDRRDGQRQRARGSRPAAAPGRLRPARPARDRRRLRAARERRQQPAGDPDRAAGARRRRRPRPVLAALIGVNVGPNLTYVGSLATLLWRRVLHREDETVALGEFSRLGGSPCRPCSSRRRARSG